MAVRRAELLLLKFARPVGPILAGQTCDSFVHPEVRAESNDPSTEVSHSVPPLIAVAIALFFPVQVLPHLCPIDPAALLEMEHARDVQALVVDHAAHPWRFCKELAAHIGSARLSNKYIEGT